MTQFCILFYANYTILATQRMGGMAPWPPLNMPLHTSSQRYYSSRITQGNTRRICGRALETMPKEKYTLFHNSAKAQYSIKHKSKLKY